MARFFLQECGFFVIICCMLAPRIISNIVVGEDRQVQYILKLCLPCHGGSCQHH